MFTWRTKSFGVGATYYDTIKRGLDRRNNSPWPDRIRVNSGIVEPAVVGIYLVYVNKAYFVGDRPVCRYYPDFLKTCLVSLNIVF